MRRLPSSSTFSQGARDWRPQAGPLRGLQGSAPHDGLLRQPRTAADEPAGTFSILSVTRGL
jgi:hypothetical protein